VHTIKLFTVGPVACYPEVLAAMGRKMMSHRSEEYLELHYDTVERLQGFLETDNDVYLLSATGTGFMEASVLSCVRDSVLICVNGSFGKRYADVAKAHGRNVILLEPPLGEPIKVEDLEDALMGHPEVEAVTVTHNESCAGLINPLEVLAYLVKDQGKLLFVDAVSSMKKSEVVPNKGWYFDLKNWQRYHEQGRGTPMTSTIPQVAGLNAALKMIAGRGGKARHFELFQTRNAKIRKGIEELGLTTFPGKGYESPTVSCINAPEGVGGPEVYNAMRGQGFELSQGHGTLKETTFRIGNMGYIPDDHIDSMLEALSAVLEGL